MNVLQVWERKSNLAKSQLFFLLLLFFSLIAFAIQVLLPGYLGYRSSEVLSYGLSDGWCDSTTQGIGPHCFGDFYLPVHYANMDFPWSGGEFPYPPIGLAIFKPFAYVLKFSSNGHLALVLYLVCCIAALIFPAIHAFMTKRIKAWQAALFVAVSVVAAPVLSAFDRGSSQFFLIPFLYLFSINYLESRSRATFIFGMVLILMKPQMILLGVIFFASREWKKLFQWILGGISLSLYAFLLYPTDLLKNVQAYIQQLINFQSYWPADLPKPTNISFASTWAVLSRKFTDYFPNAFPDNQTLTGNYYPFYITVLILLVVCAGLFLVGRTRNLIHTLFIALCLPLLLPNVSFVYYLCALLIPLLILLGETLSLTFSHVGFLRTSEKERANTLLGGKWAGALFISTYLFLFIPWAIPWSVLPSQAGQIWSSISANWLPGQISLIALFFLYLAEGLNLGRGGAGDGNRTRAVSLGS